MKNLLESIAVFFVGLLSLLIIFLIVQYNLIEDDTNMDELVLITPQKKVKAEKSASYLDSLEGYGDDTDVKVDAKKEDHTNTVEVKSEIKQDDLGAVVDDKSKSSYMKNLEIYSDKAEKEKLDEAKSVADNAGEPEKLPEEEIVDEIGMAIDAALDGL